MLTQQMVSTGKQRINSLLKVKKMKLQLLTMDNKLKKQKNIIYSFKIIKLKVEIIILNLLSLIKKK